MSSTLKPNHVWIEVSTGAEGPCLYISDDDGGERVAGPKPWGGGRTIHRFEVKTEDLRRLANERDQAAAKPLKEPS